MIPYIYFILFGLSSLVSAMFRPSRGVIGFFVILLTTGFVSLYVIVSPELAQDRYQYYIWYESVDSIKDLVYVNDPLFVLLLYVLPDNLTEVEFRATLMLLVSIAMVSLLINVRKCAVGFGESFLLVVVVVVTDRLFLDLAFNSTRSTLSALLFMHVFFVRGATLKLLCVSCSILIHFGLGSLMLLILMMSSILPSRGRVRNSLVVISCTVFFAKAVLGVDFASGLRSVDYFDLLMNLDLERINRALTSSLELTLQISIQFALAIIVPLLFLLSNKSRLVDTQNINKSFSFALYSFSIAVLFYPEFLLFHRIMVVPLLVFFALLDRRALLLLSAIRTVLFVSYVGDYTDLRFISDY